MAWRDKEPEFHGNIKAGSFEFWGKWEALLEKWRSYEVDSKLHRLYWVESATGKMRNSGKQETMGVCILILRYSLWNNVTHLLPLKNCRILSPWQGRLEEVIQNEAKGWKDPIGPSFSVMLFPKPSAGGPDLFSYLKQSKTKKQMMKKWYWIKICEGQWTVRRELLTEGRKKSYIGCREGVWKGDLKKKWKPPENPREIWGVG